MTSHPGRCPAAAPLVVLLLAVVVVVVVVDARSADDGANLKRPMTKRRVARLPGDILIGALFPVHRQPSLKTAYTRQCSEVCLGASAVRFCFTSPSTFGEVYCLVPV